MSASVTMRIDGIAEVLRELGKVEPELKKEAPKEIKKFVAPVVDDMRQTIPGEAPLSGWKPSGRLGWRSSTVRSNIKSRFRSGKRARAKSQEFSLVSIVQTSAAGSIFDMAGRKSAGSTPSGQAMIRALNGRYGQASRTLWPTLEKNRQRLEAGIREILDELARKVNRRLY